MNTIKMFIFFVTSTSVFSQSYSPTTHQGVVVDHRYFSLSYVEEHEQAEWVYYHLIDTLLKKKVKRVDHFRTDPLVTTGSAALEDYENSNYDRGHLVPAADMVFSEKAMSASFLLSNVSPQEPSFNRGIWKKLEALVHSWVVAKKSLHIVTGPIFQNNKGYIGSNKVTVPGAYYKVIYANEDKKMIGFVLPNQATTLSLQNFVLSVDAIENLTKIDFFHQLDDAVETVLEAHKIADYKNF